MNATKFLRWCSERGIGYGAARVIASIENARRVDFAETVGKDFLIESTALCGRSISYIMRDLEHRGLAILSRGSIRLTDATISQLKALS